MSKRDERRAQRIEFGKKIRTMKAGERLQLGDSTERIYALRIAKTLHEAGVIKFRLHTFKNDVGFVAEAVA
jgi:hypothetical protein